MKVSIITVSYNAADTIEETIKSVINQTYDNIEYLIIDGGSTDGTVDIIKKYSNCIAYWVSEPDKGIYDAMNKGVRKAIGDYILFLGADDIVYPNAISEIFKCPIPLNAHLPIIYGNVLMLPQNIIYGGRFNRFKLVIKNIPHQGMMIPRNFLLYHPYNIEYKVLADYVFNLQYYREFKYVYKNVIISKFMTGGTSGVVADLKFENNRLILIKTGLGNFCYYIAKIRLIIKKLFT